jgi:membrane-bound lytic murein transglycosylase B
MKGALALAPLFVLLCVTSTRAASNTASLTPAEEQRKARLKERLCAVKELSCAYVSAIFNDPRLIVYRPSAIQPSSAEPKEPEPNPLLTKGFGLLTRESLERCREFFQAYTFAFAAAYRIYGVPREVICGILRIETDFGIPTGSSPNPVGSLPALNQLVTLYVRQLGKGSPLYFAQHQEFALHQLKYFLQAANRFAWDVFQIPGSPTGAIGLAQFEPSSLNVAVDGDGDGKVDLFNPADAIVSIAHYLVTRGWDAEEQHQERAIYAYYGGNYNTDGNRYYLKAVLKYAREVRDWLRDIPAESHAESTPTPMIQQQKTLP